MTIQDKIEDNIKEYKCIYSKKGICGDIENCTESIGYSYKTQKVDGILTLHDDGIELPYISIFYGKLNIKMRYVTLILMILQSVFAVLCMRLSLIYPSKDGKFYLSPVSVVVGEFMKLITSLILIFITTSECKLSNYRQALYDELTSDYWGNILVCIPGTLFLFQNNLLYVALKRLPVSIYQVIYQLKIITTALFSVIILKRKLSSVRWFACSMLVIGVVLVPKSSNKDNLEISSSFEIFIGLISAIICSITSGLGAVILEKVIKGGNKTVNYSLIGSNEEISHFKTSIWGRNVILALIGIIGGIPLAWFSHKDAILKDGVFQGFNFLTIIVILLNAYGGFIILGVLKYADGIVKCFCNAITIVLISIISWIIEDSTPTAQFFLGALIVISAVNIYTLDCFIPSSIGVYVKQKLNYKSLSVWNKRQCI
ncbi:UDP-galactose transporter family protein [Cryptosporidium andersoni]|uniref:UDP-galactose transporter family protein n=1 Tax=Cryptosporidium andersoni TaxID=117008 RepID=A0A1J4MLY5_9CRYT|nr:UDP-galactose transporter family protein [Cryptosporidium andersoni]